MKARILLAKIMTSDIRAAFLQLTIQKAFVPLSTRAENIGQASQRGRRLGSLEGQHGGRVQRQEDSVVWLIIMIQGGTVQFPEGVHLYHTKTLWKTSFYPLSTL